MVRINLCPSRIFTDEEKQAMDKKRRKREKEDISKLTGVTPSVSKEDLAEKADEVANRKEVSADVGVSPTKQASSEAPTMEAGTTMSSTRVDASPSKDLRRSSRISVANTAQKAKINASKSSLGKRSAPEEQNEQVNEAVPKTKPGKRTKRVVEEKQIDTKGQTAKKKTAKNQQVDTKDLTAKKETAKRQSKAVAGTSRPSTRSAVKLSQNTKQTRGRKFKKNVDDLKSISGIFASFKMPVTISKSLLLSSNYDALAARSRDVSADPSIAAGDASTKVKSKSGMAGKVAQDISAVEKESFNKVDKPAKKKLLNANLKSITKKKTGKVAQKPKPVGKVPKAKKEKVTKAVQKPKQVSKQKMVNKSRKPKQLVKAPTAMEKAAIKNIKSLLPAAPKRKGQVTKIKSLTAATRKSAAPKTTKRRKAVA